MTIKDKDIGQNQDNNVVKEKIYIGENHASPMGGYISLSCSCCILIFCIVGIIYYIKST